MHQTFGPSMPDGRRFRPGRAVAATLIGLGLFASACSSAAPSTTAPRPTTVAPAQTAVQAPTESGASAQTRPAAPTAGDPVVVAYNITMTGPASLDGDLGKKAADIAADKINAEGGIGGHPVQVVVEDSQSTNQGALAALNKAGEDKAIAMVGPVKSTQILAIEPRIRELELPSLLGGTNPTYTQQGDAWLFRLRPADSIAGPAMAQFMLNDLHVQKIGILHDSDAFGTTGADLVEQTVKTAGLQVARRESYKSGDKDFTAQILSLKQAGVDGLIDYGTNVEDDIVILRQLREQGLDVPIVGSPSWGQSAVWNTAKDAAKGVYVVADYFPGRTAESQTYLAAWKAKYQDPPDGLSAWYWDALMMIRDYWPQANGDKQKFIELLHGVKDWKGAVGTISFDSNGDGLHSVDILQYDDNLQQQYIRTVSLT